MARTAVDYLKLLLSLLPRGAAWNRHAGRLLGWGAFGAGFDLNFSGARMSQPAQDPSVVSEVLYSQAHELARVDVRSEVLLQECDTRHADELLADHEADFGLPDFCLADAELSPDQRRTVLWLKLRALGQQNKEYFISLAESLGFPNTIIEEFRPGWCGIMCSGDPCGDQSNLFYWKLWLGQETEWQVHYFLAGQSNAGEHLSWLPLAEVIDCLIAQRYKPAHTQLLWGYYGYEFGRGFNFAFPSLPPMQNESADGLLGSFNNRPFSLAFDICAGGAFNPDEVNGGFDGPSTPPSVGETVMAEIDASDRDADEWEWNGQTQINTNNAEVGKGDAADATHTYINGFQFQMNLPMGVVVEESHMEVRLTAKTATNKIRIYGEAIASPAVFAAGVGSYDLSARTRTTAFVDWDIPPLPTPAGVYTNDTPNLSPILNEIMSDPDWVEGNYISLLWYDRGSVGGINSVCLVNCFDAGSHIPRLHTTYMRQDDPTMYQTITIPVENTWREAHERADTGVMGGGGATITIGHDNVGNNFHGGISFRVPIDFNLVAIQSATLRMYLAIHNNNPSLSVHMEIASDSVVFGAGAFNLTNRPRTGSRVLFEPTAVGWQDPLDVTRLLQDFAGHVGKSWQADNHLSFILMSIGNPINNFVRESTWDFVGGLIASLTITYTDSTLI